MNILLSTTSLLPAREISVLILATIGGVFVFVGLAVEKFAEWMNDQYLGGTEKPHKPLETAGWCILMFGIFVEIAVAGSSANDAWETRQMVIKNDPRNQPIASARADVNLILSPEVKLVNFDRVLSPGFVYLSFGQPNNNFGMHVLLCSSCNELAPGWWLLKFNQDAIAIFSRDSLVRDVNESNKIFLKASFLPKGTKILAGDVAITVNSTSIPFIIGNQQVRSAKEPLGSLLMQSVTVIGE